MLFKGSGVALITPFDENKKINFNKLEELIEYHILQQTDAIIVCGTTGESSTLSNQEKKEVIEFAVKVANKRIPIIAGTGSNNTNIAIEMTQFAKQVGADGSLIVTPYYNKCNQNGLFEHYQKIANSVPAFPIILYNVPTRTCVDISIDTILKLSHISNIVGIKEASPDITKIAELRVKIPESFSIYSGNDDLLLPILSLGGDGVISVAANLLPNEIHQICDCFSKGNIEKARTIFYQYLPLMKKMFLDVNPIPIKYMMNLAKKEVGDLRLPLTNPSNEVCLQIENELKKLHLI